MKGPSWREIDTIEKGWGRGVALTVKGPSWRGIDTIEKGWGRGVALTVKGPSWRGIDTIEKGWEGIWGGGCTYREGSKGN